MSLSPTRVGIVGKARLSAVANHVRDIVAWLQQRGVEAVLESQTAQLLGTAGIEKDQLPERVDLVLVLGGDGTLLSVADRMGDNQVPILGVNFGALGFLTEITLPELYPSLERALAGMATIDERLMLKACVTRKGSIFERRIVLNDVVITKGALARIIDLSVSVGDQFVTHFKADGLIVATATGSTAYNLAAGGPILHPGVDALVMTPIAPHTLTNRPLVIPAAATVEVVPVIATSDGTSDEIYITFDGQFGFQMHQGDAVRVSRAPHPLRLVRASTRSYFEVLRQKLKWGG